MSIENCTANSMMPLAAGTENPANGKMHKNQNTLQKFPPKGSVFCAPIQGSTQNRPQC